jgi:hypothetical protein
MMGRRILTLVRSPEAQTLAQGLALEDDLVVDEGVSGGDVIKSLLADPPAGLLAEVDLSNLRVFEAVLACGAAALPIPCLVLVEGAVEAEQVARLPAEVTIFDVQRSPETLAAELAVAISSSALSPSEGSGGSAWEVSDHLLLAVICGISASLEFQTDKDRELIVEMIGGDLWNAYGGDFEGVAALEAHLSDRPRQVSVRPVQVIPGQRQLRRKGFETLRRHGLPSRGHDSTSRETKEVIFEDVRDLMRKVSVSPPPLDVEAPQSQSDPTKQSVGERFEGLLATGLKTALARNYPEAVKAFEEAVALDPSDPRARLNLKKVRSQLAARQTDSS